MQLQMLPVQFLILLIFLDDYLIKEENKMKKMKKTIMGVLLAITLFVSSLMTALIPANEVQAATMSQGTYKIGKAVSGKITDGSDTHTYTFSLSKATLLELNYHADNTAGNWWYQHNVFFQLFNNNGKRISELYSGEHNSVTQSYYLEPGKYSVSIFPEYDCSTEAPAEYSFSFSNRGTQKETFIYANDFTTDVANKQIPFETTINGMLAYDEENDYYRINIPKSGTIQINVTDGFGGGYDLVPQSGDSSSIAVGSSGRGVGTFDVTKGTYYFCVYSGNSQGAYSFKISYNKSSTKAFTLKKKSKTSMVVKASATGATSGYQIKYRPSSGKWKTITVSGKKLNKTIKKLKKNKTYQVKIRTYYTYSGKKIYSSWGKTKKVKLK